MTKTEYGIWDEYKGFIETGIGSEDEALIRLRVHREALSSEAADLLSVELIEGE